MYGALFYFQIYELRLTPSSLVEKLPKGRIKSTESLFPRQGAAGVFTYGLLSHASIYTFKEKVGNWFLQAQLFFKCPPPPKKMAVILILWRTLDTWAQQKI